MITPAANRVSWNLSTNMMSFVVFLEKRRHPWGRLSATSLRISISEKTHVIGANKQGKHSRSIQTSSRRRTLGTEEHDLIKRCGYSYLNSFDMHPLHLCDPEINLMATPYSTLQLKIQRLCAFSFN